MLRLTLAQMRRSLGRLAAAAVAIVIGTAFVTATLLASGVMTRTTYNAVSTGYADADLVVSDGEITDTTLAALEEVPGVSAVRGYAETGTELTGPRGQTYVQTAATAADARLEVAQLAEGALPVADGQIALPTDTARLLGVEIGDTVDASRTGWTYDEAAAVDGAAGQEATPEPTESATGAAAEITDAVEDVLEPRVLTEHLTVVGTLETVSSMLGTGGVAAVTPSQLTAWTTFDDPSGAAANYWYALVATDAGASPGAVAASARAATGDVSVLTRDEKAAQTASQMTGDTGVFTAIVLGFAAVALLVAALVISNTFAVLVAQRTRTLALLRCVGADRAQLRRSVVTEALLLGGASSLAGLVLGIVLVQVTLVVLNGSGTDVPLPPTVSITAVALLVPLVVGTLITVLAALSPARAATRVSPLAALRPADAPTVGERSGRVRAWSSGVLMVGGFGLLAVAASGASSIGTLAALGIGVLGGASSFVGVVLGAVFWVPRLVGAAGRLTGHGAAGRLAAANSTRNPRRTASTSGALLIGVTLVAMMATGAASTRAALNASLDEHYPVDVALGSVGDGVSIPGLPAGLTTDVRGVTGVDQVAELTGATVEVVDDATSGSASVGTASYLDARGIDPAQAAAVLNDPAQVAGLSDATVIVPQQMTGWTGIVDGATITLREQPGTAVEPAGDGAAEDATGTDGTSARSVEGRAITVTVVVTALPGSAMILTPANLDALAPGAPVTRLWVHLTGTDVAASAVGEITQAGSDSGSALETSGAAVERAFYQRVVDTLLAVVVGLLAVAVVIALVGVANTLSLSVIERRRESATLRAIGLTRRQLRGTLAIEGLLVAGVGAVAGAALGTVYGWAGARTLLGQVSPVGLTVPWRDLALVILVALAAGLLASVLPARHAVRTPPVEALAAE